MHVTITPKKETSEAEVKITVPADKFMPFVDRAAKKLSKEQPIPGFRPGKVTLEVALQNYGQERVIQDALERAIPHFFVQAVLDNDLDAISRPAVSITKSDLQEGLEFTAIVAVLPEVHLGDSSKITVETRAVSVADEDITRELTYLAKMRATALEVARPAEKGDTVTVDFKISQNGILMEGGESKNHPVHLGEGHFVPDFEQKLQGIVAGDVREFEINFPADYAKKELQGQKAQAWVQAHSVTKPVLPEMNDDFAKKLGKFESLQHLKDELKKNIQQERDHKEADRLQGEAAEKLADLSTFGVLPTVLVDREVDHRLEEFSNMLAYQQKTIDDYMAAQKKTLPQIREEMRPAAEKAVKIGLVLREYAKVHKIEATDEEINEQLSKYQDRLAKNDQKIDAHDLDDLKENISSTIRNQKVLEELKNKATITPAKEENK